MKKLYTCSVDIFLPLEIRNIAELSALSDGKIHLMSHATEISTSIHFQGLGYASVKGTLPTYKLEISLFGPREIDVGGFEQAVAQLTESFKERVCYVLEKRIERLEKIVYAKSKEGK